MKKRHWALLTALFTLQGAVAQTLPSDMTKTVEVGGITEYRMTNGMKVLLFPDPSSPKTTVNITYLVGSRNEGYGETGMAHLLEHMMFKGSTQHKNVPQELAEHGAAANGTTWFDRTNYYETFPASDENLNWALSLESDRMVNSFIARKDLDSEMTVVRNEFERGENSPTGILEERVLSTAYLWHNYGNPTIGARSDIENVPIERLQDFYHRYYQPDNAVLIVAGKFDPQDTLKLISQKFGAIPKPSRALQADYTAEPTQDGQREVELHRVGDQKVVTVGYHVPAGTAKDFAAVDVLGEVLTDTPSGRLYKALVETKIATSVSGGAYQLHDPGILLLEAETRKDGDLDKMEKVLQQTVQGMISSPPTDAEVERAKTALLQGMEKTQRDSRRLALQLSEWVGLGDWREFFLYRQNLQKVTKADVAAAAAKYLKTSNETVGRFVPTDKPDRVDITPVDKQEMENALANLKVENSVSVGEDFEPTPANIKERTQYFKVGDGIEVALLPKKTRGETVNFNADFEFANEAAVQNLGGVAAFTGAMLMHGTKTLTREQIKDRLTELSASGSVSGDYESVSAHFSAIRGSLPEVIHLSADMMKNPSFPAEELETLRAGYLQSLEEAKSEPSNQASMKIDSFLNPYPKSDPRSATTIEEDMAEAKSIKLAQIKDFHDKFYGANRGQISIVGDFDPDEIRPILEKEFGTWKNTQAPAYQRMADKMKTIDKGESATVLIPDKTNAVYYAQMKLPITDNDPDYAALRLANYIIGGGFLNSRLATRVRQQEGLSYSIQSGLSADSQDPVGSFSVYAIAAPENMGKVKTAIAEELARALRDGFTAEEVEAAKRGYLESLKVARSQDGNLAAVLSNYMLIDRDVMWLADWDKKIAALTPEQLHAAVKKHLDLSKLSVVTAGTLPEGK